MTEGKIEREKTNKQTNKRTTEQPNKRTKKKKEKKRGVEKDTERQEIQHKTSATEKKTQEQDGGNIYQVRKNLPSARESPSAQREAFLERHPLPLLEARVLRRTRPQHHVNGNLRLLLPENL